MNSVPTAFKTSRPLHRNASFRGIVYWQFRTNHTRKDSCVLGTDALKFQRDVLHVSSFLCSDKKYGKLTGSIITWKKIVCCEFIVCPLFHRVGTNKWIVTCFCWLFKTCSVIDSRNDDIRCEAHHANANFKIPLIPHLLQMNEP